MIDSITAPLSSKLKKKLEAHLEAWNGCKRCDLGEHATRTVHFRTSHSFPCDVLFVGEAPRNLENLYGRPFIGPAGKVLDWIIDAAQAHHAFSYCIINILGCIPRNPEGKIRSPSPEEAETCRPRVLNLARLANPKLVCLLGLSAKAYWPEGLEYPTLHLPHPAWIARQGGYRSIHAPTAAATLLQRVRETNGQEVQEAH